MTMSSTNISLLKAACEVGETKTVSSVTVNLEYSDGTTEQVTYSSCTCLDTRLSAVNVSDNVNMFSKKKPLYTPNDPAVYSEWWKGTDGRCGIVINEYVADGAADTKAYFQAGKDKWERNKPTGGQYSPYRLSFFQSYNSKAAPFFSLNLDGSPLELFMDITTTLTIKCISNIGSSDTVLRWSDFDATNFELNKCYLGVYVLGRSTNNPAEIVCTSESTIDSTDSIIELDVTPLYEDVYDIYFFLSSNIIRQNSTDSADDPDTSGYRYYPIYTDNLKNYPIQLTYTASFTINFLILSVDSVASSDSYTTMSFVDISNYSDYYGDALEIGQYTAFKITVQNRNSSTLTISKDDIVIGLVDHWRDSYNITSTQTTNRPYLYLLTDQMSATNSVTVAASASTQIIVCVANFILGAGNDVDTTMMWDLTFGNIPEDYTEGVYYPFVSQTLKLYQ